MQQTPGVPTTTPPVQTQTQQSKEFNTASLCRIGQETVQDIVSRTQEVFQMLKVIQVKQICAKKVKALENCKFGFMEEDVDNKVRQLFYQ